MRFILLSAALVISAPAWAQNLDGNSLHEACTRDDDMTFAGYCIGYITGVVEGIRLGFAYPLLTSGDQTADEINRTSDILLSYCPDPNVETRQMIDVVLQYLANNPASRHEPARGLILLALQKAFPCPAL